MIQEMSTNYSPMSSNPIALLVLLQPQFLLLLERPFL
jgi:hypothetical protein